MSYINPGTLKAQKRRPATQWISPEEAIEIANKVVDEANNQIAQQVLFAHQWQQVAAEYEVENKKLREKNKELEAKVKQLEKQVKPKAGKRRDEWEG